MGKWSLLLLVLISAPLMSAQTYNQIQFGWAYDFTHYNKLTTNYLGVSAYLNPTNWNGYNANFIYAPLPRFGVEVKSSSSWGSGTACATSGLISGCAGSDKLRLYQIAAGPQFQLPRYSRVTPYIHALVGGSFANVNGISGDLRGFTVIPGGGFRVQVARHIALTTGADYQYARLHDSTISSGPTLTASGIRASAGILITFLPRPAGNRTAFRDTPTSAKPSRASSTERIAEKPRADKSSTKDDCQGYQSVIADSSALDCHGRPKR